MTLDLRAAKRRLVVMIVINAAALAAGLAALIGYFRFHLDWALAAFAVLIAVGIGAQIWFIAGLRRADKGA
ncbi:MAG: hypothetical protein JWP86_835 [Phenylobacterium sp.]|nr:hypothetical protein [Phenylobacterium sp.]